MKKEEKAKFDVEHAAFMENVWKAVRQTAAYGFHCPDCNLGSDDQNVILTHYCPSVRTFHADNHHMRRR